MANFKTQLSDYITAMTNMNASLSAEEVATRDLGLAYALCSQGEALKSDAKKRLKKLGVFPKSFRAGAEKILLDTARFLLKSVTKQPALRLNEDALRDALDNERLSAPAKARIMDKAFKKTEPATSFSVEAK